MIEVKKAPFLTSIAAIIGSMQRILSLSNEEASEYVRELLDSKENLSPPSGISQSLNAKAYQLLKDWKIVFF